MPILPQQPQGSLQSVLSHIVSETNRRCAILLFLFCKRSSNNTMAGHSPCTALNAYQEDWSQSLFYCMPLTIVLNELLLQTFSHEMMFHITNATLDKGLELHCFFCKTLLWTRILLTNMRPQRPWKLKWMWADAGLHVIWPLIQLRHFVLHP